MSTLTSSSLPLAAAFDALLLDLDGVVYRGAVGVEYAAESIAAAVELGAKALYVTNNAARPPQVVADQLTSLGIPTDPTQVMTSSIAAAAMLRGQVPDGSKVLCIGGPGLSLAIADQGFEVVASAADEPAAVLQGFGPTLGWADLTEAAYAIGNGALYLATNLDATLPTERGMAVGNGSLVAAVINATGVRPASSGKPEAGIFHEAAGLVGSTRPLVVGDRLDTDLAGARAAGMVGLHVLTGVSQAFDLIQAAPHERPDLLALDLRGLLEAHPAPVAVQNTWTCNAAEAFVEGGALQLRRAGSAVGISEVESITIDELRVLCVAAWEAVDGGHELSLYAHPVSVVAS